MLRRAPSYAESDKKVPFLAQDAGQGVVPRRPRVFSSRLASISTVGVSFSRQAVAGSGWMRMSLRIGWLVSARSARRSRPGRSRRWAQAMEAQRDQRDPRGKQTKKNKDQGKNRMRTKRGK